MKFRNIIYLFLLPVIIIAPSCKPKQDMAKNTEIKSLAKSEDFDKFYKRFFDDQKFQVSRVTFPLKCLIFEGEEERSILNKEDWIPFKTPIDKVDTKTYKVEKKTTPNEVIHRIYIENSDVDILINYKLIKGKWYLVYYKSIML